MIEYPASLTKCTNCGADLADVYCACCGERQPGHHDLSVAHFAHDVFHEIAHVDSKLIVTLRDLITRPGFLTQEYFAGRKSRYIPALRLFLVLFALQFLAFTAHSPAALYTVKSFEKFDNTGAFTKTDREEGGQRSRDPRRVREPARRALAQELHPAATGQHPRRRARVEAAAHPPLSRRAPRLRGTPAVVCLHPGAVVDWPIYAVAGFHPGPLQKGVTAVTVGIQLVYVFLAQRRFYGDSTTATGFKTIVLGLGRWAVTVVLLVGSFLGAVAMLR